MRANWPRLDERLRMLWTACSSQLVVCGASVCTLGLGCAAEACQQLLVLCWQLQPAGSCKRAQYVPNQLRASCLRCRCWWWGFLVYIPVQRDCTTLAGVGTHELVVWCLQGGEGCHPLGSVQRVDSPHGLFTHGQQQLKAAGACCIHIAGGAAQQEVPSWCMPS